MTALLGLFFGLMFGSFLNVCIHRIPREESLVRPRSRCPGCLAPIAWFDNIPVLSWLLLGGRCRSCGTRISARYPLVELLMGLLTGGLAWRWGGFWPWLAACVLAAGALVVLSFIDYDTFFIPDVLSLGLVALGVAAAPFNPWFDGGLLARLGASLFGGLFGFLLTWGLAEAGEWWFKREALGGGDVKLLAGVGALLGWQAVFSSLMLGSLAGSVYGGALLLSKKADRHSAIPFGPFLSLGALVNLFQRLGPLDLLLTR